MALELGEFFHDLRQDVLLRASAGQDFLESEFALGIAEELTQAGVIDGFESCPYKAPKGQRVDGYWFEEDQDTLSLFIVDYANRTDIQSLTRTEVETIFKRLFNFFTASLDGLHTDLEETSPGYGLAREIHDRSNAFSKVDLYLFSERVLSEKLETIEDRDFKKWSISHHIWDISRLHRMETAQGAREELIIDFEEVYGQQLQCLPAHLTSAQYESYLVVMPGKLLADLYGRFGSRLLEQNVRSFLQARGKVNKGIRSTIMTNPEMFFAFNNGITATATELVTEKQNGSVLLKSIRDLQIVNGGQTTASLFHTQRKDKASLDKVFVQMKLSVVEKEKSEEIVPKISEYANTQNKVSAADFFSNHPFHVRMEEFSRRLWAPALAGSQRETKWFYERARGQYADGQAKLGVADKKRFIAEFPKAQMFTKTDLAKYENVWDEKPTYVNLGAQKNFAQYARRIGKEWEENSARFNEHYFKRAISRGVIFKTTEKVVSTAQWYNGGYRANVVAYTLALMGHKVKAAGKSINYEQIWNRQKISENFESAIRILSKAVHENITQPPAGISNVTEWCKRDGCWESLKSMDLDLPAEFLAEMVDESRDKENLKDAAKVQKIDDGIIAQREVLKMGAIRWQQFKEWCPGRLALSPRDQGILDVATKIPRQIPSEKQSIILLEVLERAKAEGWI